MDLQQEWQNMNAEINIKNKALVAINVQFDQQSHNLMQDLLFKLKWKLRWIRILDIPILVMAFASKGELQLCLLAIFISFELSRALGMRQYARIRTAVDYNSNIKTLLQDNLHAIRSLLRMESIFGYFFLPLSAPMGWIFYQLYTGKTLAKIFQLSHFPVYMLLLIAVGIPMVWITKRMNDSIFKKPMESLAVKLEELTEPNNQGE